MVMKRTVHPRRKSVKACLSRWLATRVGQRKSSGNTFGDREAGRRVIQGAHGRVRHPRGLRDKESLERLKAER